MKESMLAIPIEIRQNIVELYVTGQNREVSILLSRHHVMCGSCTKTVLQEMMEWAWEEGIMPQPEYSL